MDIRLAHLVDIGHVLWTKHVEISNEIDSNKFSTINNCYRYFMSMQHSTFFRCYVWLQHV